MNSRTKIWVIPKGLLLGICFMILIIVILSALLIMTYADGGSTDGDVPVNGMVSDISTPDASPYIPGVYTSSISLDSNQMSVKVTVDADNINSIDLIYSDEAVPTMYPMLSTCFNELAAQVCRNGSADNITYNAENRYTSSVILEGIKDALAKAGR